MKIKSHGFWRRYKPDKPPESAPANTLFTRRDNTDWYDYVNSGRNFAGDSIKLTVVDGVVGAATLDPTMLFPADATVLEISDVAMDDPQQAFGSKVYDASQETFSDPKSSPVAMTDHEARIAALEAALRGT